MYFDIKSGVTSRYIIYTEMYHRRCCILS